ncbi:MAG TPA: ATP-dependent DNA helicase UvrD2 [Actinomycetes bacterium]|nr:ATP-dependent DNA helicase UvrD2 [Actinomycetes bacterium]
MWQTLPTVHPKFLTHDLNPAQREAVSTTVGPLCILAGAGTGKTRVISRRVAYAIATGAVHPGHVLVVTFTDKAANEMRERLAALGFPGVQAQTFHAAAFRQLRYFWGRLSDSRLPEVLDSKAPLLAPLQRSLPGGYKFTAIKDLADELDWAKARRLDPSTYQDAAEAMGRTPPIPGDLFAGVFRRYERAKERAGRIDFEDMLVRMLEGFETREDVATEFRGQYRWFSVDEYQDTNPLQQALLEAWLGERRDLAVVGDEDQTIYTFTGATSEYLTGFTRRFPEARVVRLEDNYRSSPEVLALANRLLAATPGRAPGRGKRLVATRPPGPEPTVAAFENAEREVEAVVAEVGRLTRAGVDTDEVAVLVRTNAQIPPLEEALAAVGIRYQVRGELFFRRTEVLRAIGVLRSRTARSAGGGLVDALEAIWFERFGFRRDEEPDGEEARQRHASLVTLLGIAERLEASRPPGPGPGAGADPDGDSGAGLAEFLEEVGRRAAQEAEGTGGGVNLLTYHRAKGLEFDAVLLPAVEEGVLPIRQASTPAEVAEERRLLYVGLTRARVHLWLSWAARRAGPSGREQSRKPSRFLDDLVPPGSGRVRPRAVASGMTRTGRPSVRAEGPLAEQLRAWRRKRAEADGVPAYVVFNDRTLAALTERQPRSRGELLAVEGIGPSKLDRYGDELLALLTPGEGE